MRKYKVWITNIIVLSSLFLTSCVSYQKYPSEWAEIILPKDESCLDVAGTYMNSGEKGDIKNSTHLSILLGFEERTRTATHVQIMRLDNDNLQISVWNEQKLISKRLYSKKSKGYRCSSKGIELPIGKIGIDGKEAFGGAAGERITLYLAKSTDGSLVIEHKSSVVGYSLLFIPVVGGRHEWYRFKSTEFRKP